ncbi:dtdp-d-glucose 46-dehydratase-related [Anaeramoeba flamelloides]|uniref:Dtdp-d-glucose 46-dehydratase-related n=1 Tax=Anaeramoeba flamelloides TaxID=1746091 RepID=A0AAV7Y5H1_9EUKA|nr:dtdp-d-glucose 46-dehydratase-related [Anaeramoeba flamelloides]|eukprot:Anaeramoba_flamelloidesa334842_68.p1 GENE.a334842_68~~a334842_68.p1  ORF type:complete len:340 (-),score=69.41 a334842_68:151-1170(-)
MNICVTGSTGMVGNNLVRHLLAVHGQDIKIKCLYRPKTFKHPQIFENLPVELVPGDMNDQSSLVRLMEGCSEAYNVAGLVGFNDSVRREDFYNVNVLGSLNFARAAAQTGTIRRIVQISSATNIPYDHGTAVKPVPTLWRDYNRTKNLGEHLASEECRKEGIEIVTVSPTGVIGRYDWKCATSISKTIQYLSKGKFPIFPKDGGYDFVGAMDIARVCERAMAIGKPNTNYLVASGRLEIPQLLDMILKASSGRKPLVYAPSKFVLALGYMKDFVQKYVFPLNNYFPMMKLFGRETVMFLREDRRYDASQTTRELGVEFENVETVFQRQLEWMKKVNLIK